MKVNKVWAVFGAVAGGSLAFAAAPALAATLYVHQPTDTSCGVGSPYITIQSAVTAASPGDHVEVCPGTYVERVTVPAGKDNLTLESVKPLQAIIQDPPTPMLPTEAIVRVNGARGTGIARFTITGPGPGPCGTIQYGVRVDSGGSADIEQNHITKIEDSPPLSGCQNGVAIQVGRADPPTDDTTGSATIRNNLIDNYQKNGVTIANTGSSGLVQGNVVRGAGPTDRIAQNGVQISDGATAAVAGNWISGNVYTPQTSASTGILLFGPDGTVNVAGNYVQSNDVGIYAYQVDQHTTLYGNQVSSSTFDGITVDTSTGPQINQNNSSNNTTPSNGEGFGIYNTTGARLDSNQADNNATNGFFADSLTKNNTFSNGEAHGNTQFDCRDDSTGTGTAGTANFWFKDQGVTSQPAGICKASQHHEGHGDHHGGEHQPEHSR